MPNVTIRNLPEETRRALKLRAARNGRSVAAEIRVILEEAVATRTPLKIGTELAAIGKRFGGINLENVRDQRPMEPAIFD